MAMILIVFVLLFNYCSTSGVNEIPKVQIDDGIIVGTNYRTVYGREVHGFFGIPYAAPPIGENRFEPPKDVKPWIGEWNATLLPSVCLQYEHSSNFDYKIFGEEDCLYLNIYTPKLPDENSNLLDVIIYIHGGCFMYGDGNVKKPDYLFKHGDIVYVTLHYRVGPLGFLSTGDNVIPGNNGLKDQSKALQWIQKNIAKFGGNPSRVTISGMSAGGASIHYHFLSSMSDGLFQRGISQSASALVPWALPRNVTEKSKRLASFLGCPTGCSTKMLECLKTRPAKKILENVKEFMPWLYNPYSPFGPVVEPVGPNSFLSEKPIDIIRNGKVKNIPWLISVTKDEGLYPAAEFIGVEKLMEQINENWENIAPHLLDYNYTVTPEVRDTISQKIREHFFKNGKISPKHLTEVLSDRLFIAYIEFTIREQAKKNPGPIYFYKFNYRGKTSLSDLYAQGNPNYGVSHGDDTMYILITPWGKPHEDLEDEKMIDFMAPHWITFARTGELQENNIVNWPQVSKNPDQDGVAYLKINSVSDISVENTKDTNIFDFWNSLLNEYEVLNESVHEEL